MTLLYLGLILVTISEPPPEIVLENVAARVGVSFRYDNGSRGRHDLPEIMGGGVALIDFDGDGNLDLFFCNGGPIEPGIGKEDPPCRTYRNSGNGAFTDVTALIGLPGPSYAMGAAVGDYDRDGRDDLFVTGWREQRLYHNLGGGQFEDVTKRSGLESTDWSTSAAWADLDGDGDLDLYVCTYLTFDPDRAPYCAAPDGRRDYCGPEDFPAQADHLYKNNGDGTFTEVRGVDEPPGRGLGVVIADLVGDALPDIFVANDGTACRLLENLGGMTFHDVATTSGVAYDAGGRALAGMGTAVGDVDGDGKTDLFVTNFHDRSTIGFRALGRGLYRDESGPFRLIPATRNVLGFGLALVDLDSDGALDLIQANGHVLDRRRLGIPDAMPPTLLRNVEGRFADAEIRPGAWMKQAALGRGLAVGDLDNDGRPDVVMSRLDGPPAVLMNRSSGSSIALELVGRDGSHLFGARVRMKVGGRVLVRDLPGGGSYLSASDSRLFFGIGKSTLIDSLEVTWPDGTVETRRDLPASRSLRVKIGTGIR